MPGIFKKSKLVTLVVNRCQQSKFNTFTDTCPNHEYLSNKNHAIRGMLSSYFANKCLVFSLGFIS